MSFNNRAKFNIKDNRIRVNKLLNNSKKYKIKNLSFYWKANCIINNIEDITFTQLKTNITIKKINNTIILEINPNIIGFKNYGDITTSVDTVNSVNFQSYNIVNSDYEYNIIPKKYCPLKDIIIVKNSNINNLNDGLLCYEINPTLILNQTHNLMRPVNISIKITTNGEIIIYDCEFIETKNKNIYMNNYVLCYNLI